MMLGIFVLVVAFFAWYSLSPFFEKAFRNKRISDSPEDRQNLLYRKEEVLTAINDLEYDFQLKKIAETDYMQLKEKLTQEAIELIKRLDDRKKGEIPATNAAHITTSKPRVRKIRRSDRTPGQGSAV